MAIHSHDRGLHHDLQTLALTRRKLLRWSVGASVVTWLGCETNSHDGATGTDSGLTPAANGGSAGASADTCSQIPEETAGPYPGDGSNGANALALSGIIRSDIRSSFAGASSVAAGVPLAITLTAINIDDKCAPLSGCAVYLWHCDRDGNYSMYSSAVKTENYLRGVQETDASGQVTFQSIFPACYSGRWPHIHFEVYPSLDAISSSKNKLATSQLALPKDTCDAVFATSGYEQSVRNLAQISLASDMVFSDGVSLQTPSMGGSISSGLTCALTVPVRV